MKGNLSEHAACCSHCQWWYGSLLAARKPFALPGTHKRYAPDVLVRVHHLKLVLSVEPERRALSGICHTTFEPIGHELSEVFFQLENMKIERVSVAGAAEPLTFEKSDEGITVKLPKTLKRGEKLEVAVTYRVDNPKAGIYFTGPSVMYPTKPYQVWTQGQDEDAHHWFPVLAADHPNHKMTSEVIVTVPEGYQALSNGKLVQERTDNESKANTFHWLQDRPHVCYLVTLVVGKFEKLTEAYKDLPVEMYFDKSFTKEAKLYFPGTADLVALFSRLYGVEYPWTGKYSQVMVQDFIFGGMENTTMTTMTDRILADPGSFDEFREAALRLNAHELNHDWNGDYITCRTWEHAWLNEGRGATYGEVEAMEHVFGLKVRDYYVKGLADTYFAEDQRYRRPIVTNVYKEPIDLFDRHLYQKGGLVAHMIRYLLGDVGYYESVRTFLTDNAYQCVETSDYVKAIEKATGRNLREFFDQWVYGAGFPEYKVTYSWDDKNKVATVKVSQTQKLEEQTGLFTMPILFSFKLADGSMVDRTVTIADKDTTLSFALASKPVMFRFDPENWVLKKLDLTALPKSMLIHQLENDTFVMGRVYAAQALAKLGGLDAIEALERQVKDTFFWGVSAESAKALGVIGTPAAAEALRKAAASANPKVRRAVVSALGNFKDEETVDLLSAIVGGGTEKSIFVKAEAAAALGKTKSSKAYATLEAALAQDSWLDTVRVGVLNGLAELGDERAIEHAVSYSAAGKPWHSRPAAISALGKFGKKSPAALTALHELADSEEAAQFTLRMSVIGALGEAKSPESKPFLNKIANTAADGRVKRAVAQTIAGIENEAAAGSDGNSEALKGKVEKLEGQVKDLTERLERKEMPKPRRKARKTK
jgi:aminopeptidase N